MIEQDAIVIYKEHSPTYIGSCGIVEGEVKDQPDHVWVRWVGEFTSTKEPVKKLIAI
jgi:hypothetical protein